MRSPFLQALCRVYRYGQTKPVFVYRLVAAGTIEQKVFDRQTQKSSLALRVVDDRSQRRAFESTEFDNYLAFSPPPPLDVDKLHNCIPVKQVCLWDGRRLLLRASSRSNAAAGVSRVDLPPHRRTLSCRALSLGATFPSSPT